MAIALVGPTGIGKTYTTFTYIREAGKVPILVRSLEDLAELDVHTHTDIIFDDISFNTKKPELLIHLCDTDFPAPVRILRNSVTIPPHIRKWFTHNSEEAFKPLLGTIDQQAAIKRRLTIKLVSTRAEVIKAVRIHLLERSIDEDIESVLKKDVETSINGADGWTFD